MNERELQRRGTAEGIMEIPPKRRGKVLVVDDDPLIRDLLFYLLSEEHELVMAADGPQGLASFKPDDCAVALIDLDLPGLTGDQVAREIKQVDLCVATVLITARDLLAVDPRLKEFDFWVPKPFPSLEELQETVDQAMKLHDHRLIAIYS